jgi:hypothetical protein
MKTRPFTWFRDGEGASKGNYPPYTHHTLLSIIVIQPDPHPPTVVLVSYLDCPGRAKTRRPPDPNHVNLVFS